jgi:hypothetical protein
MYLSSGIARIFGTQGEETQWLSLTEIMNFTEITMIEFFIWFSILKDVDSRKYKFLFKVSILHPLDSVVWGPPNYTPVCKSSSLKGAIWCCVIAPPVPPTVKET